MAEIRLIKDDPNLIWIGTDPDEETDIAPIKVSDAEREEFLRIQREFNAMQDRLDALWVEQIVRAVQGS